MDPIFDPIAIEQWATDVGIFGMMNTKWGWPIAEIIHFYGLCLLIGWFAFVAILLHRGNPVGVGWGAHAIAAAATLDASMRIAGTHAHALLPDWLVRRWGEG